MGARRPESGTCASRARGAGRLAVRGKVVAATRDGTFEIELERATGCEGCAGLCFWRRLPTAGRERFDSNLPLALGDEVAVTLPVESLLSGTLLLHGLPLAALLAGGAAGAWLGADAGCLAGAALGLAAAVLAAPRLKRRVERATLERVELEPLQPPEPLELLEPLA